MLFRSAFTLWTYICAVPEITYTKEYALSAETLAIDNIAQTIANKKIQKKTNIVEKGNATFVVTVWD